MVKETITGYPFGKPTETKYLDYVARWEEFVRACPVNSAIIISLPLIVQGDIGRYIAVKNVDSTSSHSLTVLPPKPVTIEGETSYALNASWEVAYFMAADLDQYVIAGYGNPP